jgi:hypothetical protein
MKPAVEILRLRDAGRAEAKETAASKLGGGRRGHQHAHRGGDEHHMPAPHAEPLHR